MLHERGVYVEAKPFSIGFRVEHPQGLIDRARWGKHAGHPLLGAADYKLVHHASNARSVYSFGMCPGAPVVAATSEPGRVVTNGMPQHPRHDRPGQPPRGGGLCEPPWTGTGHWSILTIGSPARRAAQMISSDDAARAKRA